MRRFVSGTVTVLLVACVGGCGAEGDAPAPGLRPTVTDSAGVELVRNRIPPGGFPVYATLDSAPDLDLRSVPGDEGTALRDVEGVVTLPDGRTAVANGSTLEVVLYGPDGLGAGRMGGQGFDDGEYWDLSRMGRTGGDTLWVADYTRSRLTLSTPEGGQVSVHDLPAGYSLAGRFGDGSFLLVPRWPVSLHESHPVDGVRRDSATYLRWWPVAGDTATAGVFSHDEMLVVETERGLSMGIPPFGRKTVQAVGPGRFYVGDQDDFVLWGYDPDGTLRQSIRLVGLDLSLSPEQVAAARSAGPARDGAAATADRFWDAVPDTRPAYGRILLDAGGNLWVAEHVAALDPPRTWMVFAPDGAVQGLVTVPAGFAVQEIGIQYILGLVEGPGGDERVVRYRMRRSR